VGSVDDAKKDVLIALSQIIDPDFGTDIVSCGFVKDLEISEALEEVNGNPFRQIIGIWLVSELHINWNWWNIFG
jgi:hypothetical protein